MKYFFILFFTFALIFSAKSQHNEYRGWKNWNNFQVNYKINKSTSVSGSLGLRSRHYFSTLDQGFINLDVTKELKHHSLSFAYRSILDNNRYAYSLRHRVNIDYGYSLKIIKKHSLFFRYRIQQSFSYLNSKLTNRLRLKYIYKYDKKVKLFLFQESFLDRKKTANYFYKYRVGLGFNYKIKKKVKIEFKYFRSNEINIYSPKSYIF